MRKQMVFGALALASAVVLAGCSGGGIARRPSEDADRRRRRRSSSSGSTRTASPRSRPPRPTFEEETGATVTLVAEELRRHPHRLHRAGPHRRGPDITIGAHDWLGALVAAGVVDTIDLGDKAAEFEQVALEAMTYDGQLYALPYSLETIALIQNTDLVGDDAPATWDEMIADGHRLRRRASRSSINTDGQTGDGYTMYGFQTSFGAPVFVQDASGSYTTEVGMGGAATARPSPRGSARNGKNGTGYLSTTIDYAINNELFNSGKAAVHDPGTVGDRRRTRTCRTSQVSPIPSAGGETAAPFVGVQGFYLSSQSKNALLANEFLVNYLATEEAQQALYDADPRIPAWTTHRGGGRVRPDHRRLPRLVAERRPDAEHPRDGLGLGPLERRTGADHQRRRPRRHLEHDGRRPSGRHRG